jgi:hypothetical protein
MTLPNSRQQTSEAGRPEQDNCSAPIDRDAPAGTARSLGSKSDCNGRPTSDDNVVEAIDEQGPLRTPPAESQKR